jgi:hypothetical protein
LEVPVTRLIKKHNNNILVIMIPPFQTNGNLPAGIYDVTWIEITTHFGHTPHRLRLLAGLLEAAQTLHQAGSRWVLINGSFVTNKVQPNDIDACYDDTNLDYALLTQLEPSLTDFSNRRAAQKARFHCEFFPARAVADSAGRQFQDFFQHDRYNQDKGIVRLHLPVIF